MDKNERGRVLILGGGMAVPGGIRLTAEAAFRAGAGKVRIGTIEPAVLPLATQLPEAAFFAFPLDPDGEIEGSQGIERCHLSACDAVVLGPAMSSTEQAAVLLGALLHHRPIRFGLILDAAALGLLSEHASAVRDLPEPPILTPHLGEMAAMLGLDVETIERNRLEIALDAAKHFNSIVVFKGTDTLVASPRGEAYRWSGGNAGLATSGSGDVLAGIAGALLARGCPALEAALWAVWLHGEAGRHCAEVIGPLGFLARELLDFIPRAMRCDATDA